MLSKNQIDEVMISLEAGGRERLLITLSIDGSVTRKGTGSETSTDERLVVGRTDPPLLEALKPRIAGEILAHPGDYVLKERRGSNCKLTMLFKASGESEKLSFEFGSESLGIPREVYELLTAAIDVTEAWYQGNKAAIA